MDVKKRQKLRKFLKEIEGIRGRHTELVSVYVPAGYELIKIIQHLQEEQGTAENIKDKTTRLHVIESLDRAIRHLRLYKKTPENGLVVFAGNASERESQTDIKVWSIEPPMPVQTRLYRCDQTFVLDILKEQLDVKDVYGLIVLDNREGTIGLLRGTLITEIANLTSGVPGKIKAGGQCLNPETLIMLDDGNIIPIKKVHNPNFIIGENFNMEISESTPIISKWSNEKELFRISTCYPKIEIEASEDHLFFVRTNKGIEEKPLSNIKENDYLIMPERINLNLEDQKINFIPEMKRKFKDVNIPEKINPEFARLLGYYLGDGGHEIDRITLFEQREDVANYYKDLIKNIFNTKADLRFRKDKKYYQIRVYSRVISQLFKSFFNEKGKTLNGLIPEIILKSSDKSLASFISGFFDAEGYVVKTRVALGINNEVLAKQLQFVLLRLGITASLLKYDNKRNPYSDKIRYTISIDDKESLKNFYEKISFISFEKQSKLKKLLINRGNKNKVRQIIVNGIEIARMLRKSGLNTTQFRNPGFFVNKRQLSKEMFKKIILDKIKDEDLKKRLMLFYNSNLIAVKIKNINKLGIMNTTDIETKNHNFIANGLIVHNSAQRFARLREEAAHEFYKRIAEISNKEFYNRKEVKGIILGGPGPTKETFLRGDYLNNEVKKKILGTKDLSYTGEFGLHELVDKSHDLLAQESVIKEKQLLEKFFNTMGKDPKKVTYDKEKTKKALEYGAVDILLLSEDLDENDLTEFENLADAKSTHIEIISNETKEGQQFKQLGGIGALLRFSI